MTAITPIVKAPKTRAAARCARCNRALKPGAPHTVTPLGTLGPECEQYAAQAQMILQRAGLGTLATQGEMRYPVFVSADGGVSCATPDAECALKAMAYRIGVILTWRYEPSSRQIVYSLTTGSARDVLNRRAQGVQA